MSQKADLVLHPNRFQIAGPPALIAIAQAIVSDDQTPEMREQLDRLFESWHVICSVSGEKILLCDLKYWDVPKQEVYARPELVPARTI